MLARFDINLPAVSTWEWKIILPLGISFYTFQTISYSIDVYRGLIMPINHFPTFMAYVSFWPQLVAGPILRFREIVPQLLSKKKWDLVLCSEGVKRITIGLFKKVIIADSIAPLVEFWFSKNTSVITAVDIWVSCFLFGYQIYFDFSGYSDIAIGSAKLLGINFPENFNWPYMADSPKEFWKRWHISLSSWIRDYLYLPLMGEKFNDKSEGGLGTSLDDNLGMKRHIPLLITWALMGLWHGANWTFVIWGIFHGLVVLLYRIVPFLKTLPKGNKTLAWIIMTPITMIGWLPFRAESFDQLCQWTLIVFNPIKYQISPYVLDLSYRKAGYSYLVVLMLFFGIPVVYYLKNADIHNRLQIFLRPFLNAIILLIFALMVFSVILYQQPNDQFIYFQF
ncbi:MAG: MBOAT family protein [SAR324 cluster bacterium]|nr:MBOAT family protein [SAR324 cluster bacterium]